MVLILLDWNRCSTSKAAALAGAKVVVTKEALPGGAPSDTHQSPRGPDARSDQHTCRWWRNAALGYLSITPRHMLEAMFVDEAAIHVKAGDGGHGCVSFRREKYVPKGGPDGGDGGNGGSVVFVADSSKDTLLDFSGKHHWTAPKGQPGMGKKMAGISGADLVIPVPAGTLIYDDDHQILLADLDEIGKQIVIARGGKGGRGNWYFRSPTNQAPRYAEPGSEGQERNLKLELKLIADVGLVGMPNAGKSTLLRAISAARPKVADYPFTTLDPQLGIVELPGFRRLVVADLPGLIEGAQSGAGLGHAFLRHIERTKTIVHLLDMYPMDGSDPVENYRKIRHELEAFSPALAHKREVIAANKMDLAIDDEAINRLMEALPDQEIFPISGATHQGMDSLLETLWKIVQDERAATAEAPGVPLEQAAHETTGPARD